MIACLVRVVLLSPFFLSSILMACCVTEEMVDESSRVYLWLGVSFFWCLMNAVMVILTKESLHLVDWFLHQQVVVKTTRLGH